MILVNGVVMTSEGAHSKSLFQRKHPRLLGDGFAGDANLGFRFLMHQLVNFAEYVGRRLKRFLHAQGLFLN